MIFNKFFTMSTEQAYSAPAVDVISAETEGVMCVSGRGNVLPGADEDDWGEL